MSRAATAPSQRRPPAPSAVPHVRRRLATVAMALAVAACSGNEESPGGPAPAPSSIRIDGGDQQSAAVGSTLGTRLSVLVTDASGRPVSGARVQWDASAGAGTLAPAQGNTDSRGIAQTTWTLGTSAGTQRVSAQVGGLAPIPFVATALPGAPAVVVASPNSAALGVGDTVRVRAAVRDQFGNNVLGQNLEFTSPDATISVRADGLVTAVALGSGRVIATAAARADTVPITVLAAGASACGTTVPLVPAVGEVVVPAGTAEGVRLCLGATTGAVAEYGVVAISSAASFGASARVDVHAIGVTPPAVAAVQSRLFPGAVATTGAFEGAPATAPLPPLDHGAEFERRTRERRELAPLVEVARAEWRARRAERSGLAAAVQPRVATVGELLTLNANAGNACTNPDNRTGRVVAVGTRSIIVADTTNPSGGYTDAEYTAIAATFDTLVYPLATDAFGTPTDISGYGKVILFYTRAVNALTPRNAQFVIGGFFFARDLYPKTASGGLVACAASNVAEMFYLLVPDPSGSINGNVRTKDVVTRLNLGTVTHEFQHLINSSRRLYVNAGATPSEEVWLDEGLSHVAEELLFLRVAGFASRQNLTIGAITASPQLQSNFNEFASQNFARLYRYLQNPEANSPYAPNDSLATRGAIWHFLRYAAGRQPATDEAAFFRALVNSTTAGLANLTARIPGGQFDAYLRDWAVATLADDFSTTVTAGLGPAYRIPAWNFRSVFPALRIGGAPLGVYPLVTRTITSGTQQVVSLAGGTSSHIRVGVPAGQSAVLSLSSNGGPVPAAVQIAVVRLR